MMYKGKNSHLPDDYAHSSIDFSENELFSVPKNSSTHRHDTTYPILLSSSTHSGIIPSLLLIILVTGSQNLNWKIIYESGLGNWD